MTISSRSWSHCIPRPRTPLPCRPLRPAGRSPSSAMLLGSAESHDAPSRPSSRGKEEGVLRAVSPARWSSRRGHAAGGVVVADVVGQGVGGVALASSPRRM